MKHEGKDYILARLDEPSPRPWALTTFEGEEWIASDTEESGLICPAPINPPDAQLIITACNNYHALTACLRKVVKALTANYHPQSDVGPLDEIYDIVEHEAEPLLAALDAKQTGGTPP